MHSTAHQDSSPLLKTPSAVLETNAEPESSHRVHFQRTVPGCIFLCIQTAHALHRSLRQEGLGVSEDWEGVGGEKSPRRKHSFFSGSPTSGKIKYKLKFQSAILPTFNLPSFEVPEDSNSTMSVVWVPPRPLNFKLSASCIGMGKLEAWSECALS